MPQLTDIKDIETTSDTNKVVRVYNPLKEKFEGKFAGKEFILKVGANLLPEPIAKHLAKHLAMKICQKQTNEFLQKAFPGLDEIGREKWKMNTSHTITPVELFKVRDLLLSGLDQELYKKDVPETDAERKLRGVREMKANARSDEAKEEERAKKEDEERAKKEEEDKVKKEAEDKEKAEQDEIDTVKEIKKELDKMKVPYTSEMLKPELAELYKGALEAQKADVDQGDQSKAEGGAEGKATGQATAGGEETTPAK